MTALMVSPSWYRDFVEDHSWGNGQIAIFICGGPEENAAGYDLWSLAFEFENRLNELIDDAMGHPTLFMDDAVDALSIWGGAICISFGGYSVTYPLLYFETIKEDLFSLIQALNAVSNEKYAEEFPNGSWEIMKPFAKSALGWTSGCLSCANDETGFNTHTIYVQTQVDGEWSTVVLSVTGPNSDGLNTTVSWTQFWCLPDDDSDRYSLVQWDSPQLLYQNIGNDQVEFVLSDDGGQLRYRTDKEGFAGLIGFAATNGYRCKESNIASEIYTESHSDPIESASSSGGTVQANGASVHSGIFTGDVNISGLAVLSGIVNGNVYVPDGGDVNITGIVNGRIQVDGGVARMFGIANAAEIHSGRIEIYGTLNSRLAQYGGDVYYHPDSIVAD